MMHRSRIDRASSVGTPSWHSYARMLEHWTDRFGNTWLSRLSPPAGRAQMNAQQARRDNGSSSVEARRLWITD